MSAYGLARAIALAASLVAWPIRSIAADDNQYCGGAQQPAAPSDLAHAVGELTIQAMMESGHRLRCGYGYAAAKCGDHHTAVRIFRRCSDEGHAGAMIWLGALHENGHGVPRDLTAAAALYRRAALSGHAGYATLGKLHYGMALYRGEGVARDEAEGLRWLREAARDGDRDAIEFIAAATRRGQAIE